MRTDGICADIWTGDGYDYWAAKDDLRYYCLRDIREERKHPGCTCFDAGIRQVAEVILHTSRFYSLLGVEPEHTVIIGIRHSGLKGTHLSSMDPDRSLDYERAPAEEQEAYIEVTTTTRAIEEATTDVVERFTKPLFLLFDFTEIERLVVGDIVDDFKSRIRYY